MRFYLSGVDAELDLKEFLLTMLLAITVCGMPFAIKALLLLIY